MYSLKGTTVGKSHGADGRSGTGVGVALFFLVALVVYAFTADYDQVQNEDIVATAVPTWNLVVNGSTDLSLYEDTSQWIREVNGRVVSNRWPGTMLMALPMYAATAWLSSASDSPVLWPATVTAVLVSAAAAAVIFHLLMTMFERCFAAAAAASVAFGTGLWTVAAESLWTHAPAALMSALALSALRARRQWSAGWCFAGLALIRPHLLLVAAVVGYILARETKDLVALIRIGLPAAVGLALYVAYCSVLVGEVTLGLGYYAFEMPEGWSRVTNVSGALFAPRVGLLLYTPVLLCCIPMLARAWALADAWERATVFGGLVYMTVQLQLNNFFGGFGFYGYRIPLDGLMFMLPLLCRSAWLFINTSTLRAVVTSVLAVVAIWVSAIGAVFYVGRSGHPSPWTTWGPAEALSGQPFWTVGLVCVVGIIAVVMAARSTYMHTPAMVGQVRHAPDIAHPTQTGDSRAFRDRRTL